MVSSVGATQGRTGRSMRPAAMTIWSISGRTLPNLVLYLNLYIYKTGRSENGMGACRLWSSENGREFVSFCKLSRSWMLGHPARDSCLLGAVCPCTCSLQVRSATLEISKHVQLSQRSATPHCLSLWLPLAPSAPTNPIRNISFLTAITSSFFFSIKHSVRSLFLLF